MESGITTIRSHFSSIPHVKITAGRMRMLRDMVEEECGQDGIEHQKKGRPLPTVGLQVPDGREPNAPDIATPNPSHHHSGIPLNPSEKEKSRKKQFRSRGTERGETRRRRGWLTRAKKIEICFMLVGPSRRMKTQSDLVEDKTERLRMPGPQPF